MDQSLPLNLQKRRSALGLEAHSTFLVIVLVSLLLVLITFRHYGFTVDELNGFERAANIFRYLESFGAESSEVAKFSINSFYGAMPDVIGMAIQKLFPSLGLDARHLVSGIFGTVGVYYCGKLAINFSDSWTGVLASLLLLLCTYWTGYSLINLKDIPFAASLLGALYSAMRLLDPYNARLRSSYLMLGVWVGALATCKLIGVLVLVVFIIVLYGFSLAEGERVPVNILVKRILLSSLVGLFGITTFSLIFWPQIYLFSPSQLYEVIVAFINFPGWRGQVLLGGEYYNYNQIPPSYLITYLIISLPLALWTLYAAGVTLAIINQNWRMLGVALLAPMVLIVQVSTHAVVYNGARHVLFLVPFLIITAAYGASYLAAMNITGKIAATVAVVLFATVSLYNTVTLYPYQYSAYNWLVGGLSGAQGRYYVDVWRSAHREALQKILEFTGGVPVNIFSCGSFLNMADMSNFQATRLKDARYVIALPRGCPPSEFVGFRPVLEIRRGDVIFATVMERQ